MTRAVTFAADPAALFNALSGLDGDTSAIGERMVAAMLAEAGSRDRVGLAVYGIEIVAEGDYEPHEEGQAPTQEPEWCLTYPVEWCGIEGDKRLTMRVKASTPAELQETFASAGRIMGWPEPEK